MKHRHRWVYLKVIWFRPGAKHVGFDTLYECSCGMHRRDRTMGLLDQKKIWEWHYYSI